MVASPVYPTSDVVPRRSLLGSSLLAAGAVTVLGLAMLEWAIPFWGSFVVGAMVSYVATDLILRSLLKAAPGWVKVMGHNVFTTRANAYWTLLVFVVVIAPTVAYAIETILPEMEGVLPYPKVTGPLFLAVGAVSALVGDLLAQVR